jgi:hypothetical protein
MGMRKIDDYRQKLKGLKIWDQYLLDESHLPGPRANLELVMAVAEEGNIGLYRRYLAYDANQAPYGSALEFLAVCGVVGLGRLLAEGNLDMLPDLRGYASDPRWRVREGVAIGLQLYGDQDMPGLIKAMQGWTHNLLEKRAAIAALCEPRLLKRTQHVDAVLEILDKVTGDLLTETDRKSDDFRVLRKALGYCWSVAVVSRPEQGKKMMERWFAGPDPDIVWIMKENLKKKRLARMDPRWVEHWTHELKEKKGPGTIQATPAEHAILEKMGISQEQEEN